MSKRLFKRLCLSPLGRWLAAPMIREDGFRIINFHRVLPDSTPPGDYRRVLGNPTASQFERMMKVIRRHFRILPIEELVARMPDWKRGFALGVTFDDGYEDVGSIAAPILERLGIPYTVFLTTRFLDGELPWFSRMFALAHSPELRREHLWLPQEIEWDGASPSALRHALAKHLSQFDTPELSARLDELEASNAWYRRPDDLRQREAFMTWDDVRRVQAGRCASWGAHTLTHVNVAAVEGARLDEELLVPRQRIEAETGRPCPFVAYPGGRFHESKIQNVKAAGYRAGFLMKAGLNDPATDVFRIYREYAAADPVNALFQLYGFGRLKHAARRRKA